MPNLYLVKLGGGCGRFVISSTTPTKNMIIEIESQKSKHPIMNHGKAILYFHFSLIYT